MTGFLDDSRGSDHNADFSNLNSMPAPARTRTPPGLFTEARHREAMEKAKEFIQQNFAEKLNVGDVARHVCMSPYHFCRLFKTYSGISPHQYLLQVRLLHAELLIKLTPLPITDICYSTGFTRLDYFAFVFHKHYRISPSRYRMRFCSLCLV